MAKGDIEGSSGPAANSDPLVRIFVAAVVILIVISIVLAIRLAFFQRAAEPMTPMKTQTPQPVLSGVLDGLHRRVTAALNELARLTPEERPKAELPARQTPKREQATAPAVSGAIPASAGDPNRAYPVTAAPQGPQVLAVPINGRWNYDVFFGPAWNKSGRLDYVTENLANQPGKTGAGMSWLPAGGSVSKWFLGVMEADHPSHGNTRFPGFFMHPVYLPQSLQPGSRVLWEFPWQGGGRNQVRRFDMRVVDWETVSVPAGVFTAVHLKGRLQYVDNETVKADVGYSLWYAPQARQVVRLLWLGRSPDEASGEMIAELASFKAP